MSVVCIDDQRPPVTDPLSPKVHAPQQPLLINENSGSTDEASEQGENGIGFQRRNAKRGMCFKPREETELTISSKGMIVRKGILIYSDFSEANELSFYGNEIVSRA